MDKDYFLGAKKSRVCQLKKNLIFIFHLLNYLERLKKIDKIKHT